jgi:phosphopentomutase
VNVKRVFLIVLDSYGIGNAPDAAEFGDEGSNTLASIRRSPGYDTPTLEKLGLFRIDGVEKGTKDVQVIGSYGRMEEASKGKDTTIGHWEIAGIISEKPLPVYPMGFPKELLEAFSEKTKRGVLCNRPYSGTDVIRDYGKQHVDTGDLIVYTSADSVFQIAAHENVVPPEQLYEYCRAARGLLIGEHGVGRVIARPFDGEEGAYRRTSRRHDFSLEPPAETMMDVLAAHGLAVWGVGKIYDIFAGKSIARTVSIANNNEGMERTLEILQESFEGLCFVNLVDFDMVYGHRNDIDGYAEAATAFDGQLAAFLAGMRKEDVLIITADHGCDPGHPGTDHTRECVPMLIYGASINAGVNIGTRHTFADIGATVLELFGLEGDIKGRSYLTQVKR